MANNKKSVLLKWTENFDPRIYPRKAIEQAVKAYASLGTFSMREFPSKIEVRAEIRAESDFNFRAEFANYALGMVIKCR